MHKNISQKNKQQNNNSSSNYSSQGIITFFSQHKVAGNLLMALMILFGIFGLSQLKRQLMPDFGIEIVTVNVEWPGASAEDVEENIINAIEPEVRFINDVNDVDSFACDNLTVSLVGSGPSNHLGAFTLNNDGTFTYIHDGTFTNALDFFVYQLYDGQENAIETDTAYISINLPPPVHCDIKSDIG